LVLLRYCIHAKDSLNEFKALLAPACATGPDQDPSQNVQACMKRLHWVFQAPGEREAVVALAPSVA
jgi:hypothetical protein